MSVMMLIVTAAVNPTMCQELSIFTQEVDIIIIIPIFLQV